MSVSDPFSKPWENAEAYLNQRCIKKNVPESSQPISSSPPLTLSVGRRKVQPAFRQEQRTTLGDWINSTGVSLLVKANNNPKTAASLNTS